MELRVTSPVTDLLPKPNTGRTRQLVYGEAFQVEQSDGDYAIGRASRDGYHGAILQSELGVSEPPTHRIAVPASHSYGSADFKNPDAQPLSFGSQLRVVSAQGNFFETAQGRFVPKPHLRPLNAPFADPVTVAQMFFGTPYLWGGNSIWGIDCSGLVQMAFLSSGRDCPGDSGPQQDQLGRLLPPGSGFERGDLLFWKGHVALVVDPHTLIHANAHHMAVAYEPLSDALRRIEEQGDGPLLAHKRVD
ncbi:C40 family peptidase [Actibacterium pelagium]|uniref:NlpC/P60 domain-containing protein n=1 Tax=Actibacterium pelagium TaxID=2029103 RepID=A0A917EKD8_9RHOB|nr:NlpC/P60 family protein [Actibacterium pelagium]GGE56861.1 hypothetical protein GCM10011517_25790 [Actibacterium pelagium]